MKQNRHILILCTGNSARSQMAEGLWRHATGGHDEVFSAGTKPSQVRPEAIVVMREIGIDISGHRSKSVDEFSKQAFDYVITVCDNANEVCPIFPDPAAQGSSARRLHWPFADPASVTGSESERLDAFRDARDRISECIRGFLEQERDAGGSQAASVTTP